MSKNFLLNLANRSAHNTTVPQARPYLHPVFMPPSPTVGAADIQVRPQTPREGAASTPEPQPSNRTGPPGLLAVEKHQRSEPVRTAPPDQPLPTAPPLAPAAPAETGRSSLTPAEPAPIPPPRIDAEPPPDPADDSSAPGPERVSPQQIRQTGKTPFPSRTQSDYSTAEEISPQPSPGEHHEARRQKSDPSSEKPASQPSVPKQENKPPEIQQATPVFFVQKPPGISLITNTIERIVKPGASEARPQKTTSAKTPETGQLRPSHMPYDPNSESKKPSLASPEAVDGKTFRKTPSPVDSSIRLESSDVKPPKTPPTTLQTLPLTTIIERSTKTETSSHTAAPQAPAPEAEAPMPPRRAKGDHSPPIQVSIGKIDLRINPPAAPGIPSPRRRKRPQGFDGFRHRRSYSGWEN